MGLLPKELISSLTPKVNIKTDWLQEIIQIMFGLSGVSESNTSSLEEVTEELLLSLKELDIENQKSDKINKSHLIELLKISNNEIFKIGKKAINLMYDRANLVHSFKILTDIRPVFGGKNEEEVKSSVILFNLRLTFRKDRSKEDTQDVFFALDESDLKQLKEQIIRAEMKAKVSKDYYKN